MVVVVASVASATLLDQISTQSPEGAQFATWAVAHDRAYESKAEAFAAFKTFSLNAAKIAAHNAGPATDVWALNQFADVANWKPCGDAGVIMPPAPKAPVFRGSNPNLQLANAPSKYNACTDSAAGDVCTAVKNQGQCGSCWAFSAIENFESRRAMTGQTDPTRELSPQQYVDCGVQSYGCRGGWPFWAFADDLKAQSGQVESEVDYPYTAMGGSCKFQEPSPANAAFSNYTVLSSPNGVDGAPLYLTEDEAIAALVNYGPLSVCVNAAQWSLYQSGIMSEDSCGTGGIDHCVQLTGYDAQSFTIRNSWGKNWGESGHIRLARGTPNSGTCLLLSSLQTVDVVSA